MGIASSVVKHLIRLLVLVNEVRLLLLFASFDKDFVIKRLL